MGVVEERRGANATEDCDGRPRLASSNTVNAYGVRCHPQLGEFAVSSFGGFASDADMVSNAVALTSSVEDSKEVDFSADANAGNYYFVAYDSPYRLMNRHNEDWIGVEESE